jgi:hypothetical protein
LVEDRLRHELDRAFDQDHVVRTRSRAFLQRADGLANAVDAQFLCRLVGRRRHQGIALDRHD